jgi:hypothetical protein
MKLSEKIQALVLALLMAVSPVLITDKSYAANLSSRQVVIGSSLAGANTTHNYSFTIPTAGTLGSIEFEYCSNTPFTGTVCAVPGGLDVSGAVMDAQTGETGFSVDYGLSTANKLVISRLATLNLASQPATYNFSNIINPASNNTTYVRISTFASNDTTGPRTDEGAVLFSTVNSVTVEGYVPPYLTFCVAITVSLNCSNLSGNFISLGELSKNSANAATSQFSGATNDPGGYSTFLAGNTMASGTNVIPALNPSQPSNPGSSQFGINLVANSNPGIGQNPTGPGSSVAAPGFNSPNQFRFDNTVISSSTLPTNFKIFTVSYLINVSAGQKPGVYSSTFTYIATAAF